MPLKVAITVFAVLLLSKVTTNASEYPDAPYNAGNAVYGEKLKLMLGQVYDLVVYGDSSGAVIAAVAAKREGRSVILVNPAGFPGGMSASGLGATDFLDKRGTFGGIASEFYDAIATAYGTDYMDSHVVQHFVTESGHANSDGVIWRDLFCRGQKSHVGRKSSTSMVRRCCSSVEETSRQVKDAKQEVKTFAPSRLCVSSYEGGTRVPLLVRWPGKARLLSGAVRITSSAGSRRSGGTPRPQPRSRPKRKRRKGNRNETAGL